MKALNRNNVKVLGQGSKTLMFGHGYGCDQKMWRRLTPAFLNDYRVILFDHVGSGLSDYLAFDSAKYSTLDGYAADVLEIISELKLTRVHFVGHSVSSMIGAKAAIARPELFEALVMIGASPCYINDAEYFGGFERADIDDLLDLLANNHVGWSVAMAPIIMGNRGSPELTKELEESFCRTDPVLGQHFARVIFLSDHRCDLPKLQTRTLVLQSMQDAVAPVSVGRYVHEHLPVSQYKLLEATGHCPHLSAPSEVIKAITQFL